MLSGAQMPAEGHGGVPGSFRFVSLSGRNPFKWQEKFTS